MCRRITLPLLTGRSDPCEDGRDGDDVMRHAVSGVGAMPLD